MGGSFVGVGGATVRYGGPTLYVGMRIDAGWLYDHFFETAKGGTFFSYLPEVRVGYTIDSDLGQPGVSLAGGPRFGNAKLGGQSDSLSGYHLGVILQGFRFRDMARLGQAALLAIVPSTLELSLDKFGWKNLEVNSFDFSLRWGF